MSSNWDQNLTPRERREWDRFVTHVREGTVKGMMQSAFVMSLVPEDEPDVKFAVELGLAIMLGKPILALVIPGRRIPPKLRQVADAVIVADVDTEEGQRHIAQRLREFQATLPEEGT